MIGTGEVVVIFGMVLVLFGGKKLPELARGMGQGLREFRSSYYGLEESPPACSAKKKGSCCCMVSEAEAVECEQGEDPSSRG